MSIAFIPELDSKLRLTKDWTFDVHFEYRNSALFVADGHPEELGWRDKKKPYKRVLKTGTEFLVSRIYIRSGAKDFSSITLCVVKTDDEKLLAQKPKKVPFKSNSIPHWGRFWVKLADFNNAQFEVVEDATEIGKPRFVCGQIVAMEKFRPTSRSPLYWVKFEHDDPDLSFDGMVQTYPTRDEIHYEPDYKPYWPYKMSPGTRQIWDWKTQTYITEPCYNFHPLYFVHNLIPTKWTKDHENDERFKIEVDGWSGTRQKVTEHPLAKEINIPKDKAERIKLGIKDGKTKLENISIAGGKLTICKVDTVYK